MTTTAAIWVLSNAGLIEIPAGAYVTGESLDKARGVLKAARSAAGKSRRHLATAMSHEELAFLTVKLPSGLVNVAASAARWSGAGIEL